MKDIKESIEITVQRASRGQIQNCGRSLIILNRDIYIDLQSIEITRGLV